MSSSSGWTAVLRMPAVARLMPAGVDPNCATSCPRSLKKVRSFGSGRAGAGDCADAAAANARVSAAATSECGRLLLATRIVAQQSCLSPAAILAANRAGCLRDLPAGGEPVRLIGNQPVAVAVGLADIGGMPGIRLQLVAQPEDEVVHGARERRVRIAPHQV